LPESTAGKNPDPAKWHVGYYLVDKGARQPEKHAAMVSGLFTMALKKQFDRIPLLAYLGLLLFYLPGFVSWPLWNRIHHRSHRRLVGMAALIHVLIATSQLALTLTNWLVTRSYGRTCCPGWIFQKDTGRL
jgi:hypothetical protein